MFNFVNTAWSIIIILVVFAGLCVLQKFLSKKAGKIHYLGLALPILCFILAIVYSIPNIENTFRYSFSTGAFIASLLAFILMNVPTAVFLGIFLYDTEKRKRRSELEKMTIQDLK